jgi:hypothetical protein
LFLNKEKVRKLMDEKANGNYHEFSRQMGVDVSQLHRVLNTGSKAGPKFLGKLMRYCQDNNLNFKDYIFLEQPLHACNSMGEATGTTGI